MQAPATGASHVTPIAWTRTAGAALFSSRKRTTVTSHATATELTRGRGASQRESVSPKARPAKPRSRQTAVRT